jgi:hypothetical protein
VLQADRKVYDERGIVVTSIQVEGFTYVYCLYCVYGVYGENGGYVYMVYMVMNVTMLLCC